PHTDGAGVLHMARGWRNRAFRDELDDRCYQCIAKLTRDGLGHRLEHIIVFPNGHKWTIGLDPAGADDHGALPSPHGISYFHPGEFFEEDAVDAGNRPRSLEILCVAPEGEAPTSEDDEQPNEHTALGHEAFSSCIDKIYRHIKNS